MLEYYLKRDDTNIINSLKKNNMLITKFNSLFFEFVESTIIIKPYNILFDDKFDWDNDFGNGRGYLRLVHGHVFIASIIEIYEINRDLVFLEKGMEIILNWIKKYKYSDNIKGMAYHDETVALRLRSWVTFFLFSKNLLKKKNLGILLNEIILTAELLYTDKFYAYRTNHGMFQDIALLTYAVCFDKNSNAETFYNKSLERLEDYFKFIFTEDGVHKENTPYYHLLICCYLKNITSLLTINNSNGEKTKLFTDIFLKTKDFSTHIIMPNGCLPQIGDNVKMEVNKNKELKNLYESPDYIYAVTKGLKGEQPSKDNYVFKDAGYAIFRNKWEDKQRATYMLFRAGYHVDYHKHSDDLSFILYANNRNILIDSGPYGYDYNNEMCKYTYSSFAHNVLIVDGKGLPRIDSQKGETRIIDYNLSVDKCEVLGTTKRYKGVNHFRNIKYFQNEEKIIITDDIMSEKSHDYTILWHVDKGIDIKTEKNIIKLFDENDIIAELRINYHDEIRIIDGWKFEKFGKEEKTKTIEIKAKGMDVKIKTEIILYPRPSEFVQSNVYRINDKISYYFKEGEENKNKIIIGFLTNKDRKHFEANNHIKTLRDVDCNKLFIIDDDKGEELTFSSEENKYCNESDIISLITSVIKKYNITLNNIITFGVGKGSFASLYYAMKYNFGQTILGDFQIYFGNFLSVEFPDNELNKYNRSFSNKTDRHYLNNIMFDMLDKTTIDKAFPMIYIKSNKKDRFFISCFVPLVSFLNNNNINYSVNIIENRGSYDELEQDYYNYLIATTKDVISGKDTVEINNYIYEKVELSLNSIKFKWNENSRILEIDVKAIGDEICFAYYIYLNDKLKEKILYDAGSKLSYVIKENGNYRVKVFVKDIFEKKVTEWTEIIEIN